MIDGVVSVSVAAFQPMQAVTLMKPAQLSVPQPIIDQIGDFSESRIDIEVGTEKARYVSRFDVKSVSHCVCG
jgi:hypothetical protein